MIEDLLIAALDKEEFTFIIEDEIYSIFEFDNKMHETTQKAKSLIVKLTQKYARNEKIVLMLIQVVNHNFRDWFVEYFREFLLVNKEIQFTKDINFERSASWTGSKVPVIQRRIDFYQEIIKMINTLPNILDYSEHIDYFEENIVWKKREIEREQKKDFMDEHY